MSHPLSSLLPNGIQTPIRPGSPTFIIQSTMLAVAIPIAFGQMAPIKCSPKPTLKPNSATEIEGITLAKRYEINIAGYNSDALPVNPKKISSKTSCEENMVYRKILSKMILSVCIRSISIICDSFFKSELNSFLL